MRDYLRNAAAFTMWVGAYLIWAAITIVLGMLVIWLSLANPMILLFLILVIPWVGLTVPGLIRIAEWTVDWEAR